MFEKSRSVYRAASILAVMLIVGGLTVRREAATTGVAAVPWITGYWFSPPAWGGLPVSEIDFSALTHVVHYSLLPRADGGFEDQSLKQITEFAGELALAAHGNGVKVLLGIAQTGSGGDLVNASGPGTLKNFVRNIMEVVETYGYDGVDLDWEGRQDPQRFKNLVGALRARLDAREPKGLLTGAFFEPAPHLIEMQSAFDQINVMTYDNCTPAEGFSWHNAALYNAGDRRRRTVDWRMSRFIDRIPAPRLGLGIPFYGYVWSGGSGTATGGVTAPGQTWRVAPRMRFLNYNKLVNDSWLWRDGYFRRHDTAGNVPYLSIDLPGEDRDFFVTYEDETSVSEKVAYARSRGIGGIMIYELSGDYFPERDPKHPLLEAVKKAMGRAFSPK